MSKPNGFVVPNKKDDVYPCQKSHCTARSSPQGNGTKGLMHL